MSEPSDWFSASYGLPQSTVDAVSRWLAEQSWPQGTTFKKPEKLHITGFYSRTGYAEPAHHEWLASRNPARFDVSVSGIEAFTPSDGNPNIPVVLLCDAPELRAHAVELADDARALGLRPLAYGPYRPHITVAFLPHPMAELPQPPRFEFRTTELFEQHAHNDALKSSR